LYSLEERACRLFIERHPISETAIVNINMSKLTYKIPIARQVLN
jgi:hypothetical protein